jgi:hypothetical protein
MEKTYLIKGVKYTPKHLEMGIWGITTPSGNSWTFANKDKALEHLSFLNDFQPLQEIA